MHKTGSSPWTPAWAALAALPLLAAWEFFDLDLPLAYWFGSAAGFELREHWFLTQVMHAGARFISWALVLALVLAIWWPVGPLRQLSFGRRLQMAVTPLAIVALVGFLKTLNSSSCPWHLVEFGGISTYHSHWLDFAGSDRGNGRCFPAGHATAGFAFVGGYWAFRGVNQGAARVWLALGLSAGLVLGIAQQMRGAHFMSHTLWSGWIACAIAIAVDALRRQRERPSPPDGGTAPAPVAQASLARAAWRPRRARGPAAAGGGR